MTRRACARFSTRVTASRGFTLIEMAVVVFIMALILGSILVPLSTQVEQRQSLDTRRQLEEIREALIGYAITQTSAYLPCPDKTTAGGAGTANDGQEDVDSGTGTCVVVEGNLPWVTLGLAASDSWGNRYRYRVSPAYAQRLPPGAPFFSLGTEGVLKVCSATGCAANELLTLTPSPTSLHAPPAVVLSHGPNGWGALNASTGTMNLPPGCGTVAGCAAISADEQANGDQNDTFVSRAPGGSASGAGQFDDIVMWLSPHVLKQRLVAAGKLP